MPFSSASFLYDSATKAGSLRCSLNGLRYGESVSQNNWVRGAFLAISWNCCALATVVGVLVEVPVMLSVCAFCRRTRPWYENAVTERAA